MASRTCLRNVGSIGFEAEHPRAHDADRSCASLMVGVDPVSSKVHTGTTFSTRPGLSVEDQHSTMPRDPSLAGGERPPNKGALKLKHVVGTGASAVVVQAQALRFDECDVPDKLCALKLLFPIRGPEATAEEQQNELCFRAEAVKMQELNW